MKQFPQMKMKALAGLVCLSLLCGAAVSEEQYHKSSLPPPEKPYKILFLLPYLIFSHVMAVAPLAAALAARGHEVHTLCITPDVYKLPNVTCIYVDVNLPSLQEMSVFSSIDDADEYMKTVASSIAPNTEILFSSPDVLQLYEKRKEYDIIVMEQVAMFFLYPFAHETTYVLFSTSYLNPCQSAEYGNVQNPAYVTSGLFEFPQPYSFIDRVKNFAATIGFCLMFRWVTNQAEERNRKQFPGLPSMVEVERNASLHFLTTNPALEGPLPLLPTQVPVGGIILRPIQPLPKDIADFLDGDDPVIYMSFGLTFVREDSVDQKKKGMLISVLRRLPYKVIFKMKGQEKKKVSNILFHNAVPQQDILAHPNVKLFVSHYGLAGTQEAVHNGVPIVGFPAIWEHAKTAGTIEAAGAGIQLSWSSFTEETFGNAIKEVMTNPSYRRNMAALSQRYRDQPDTPLDRAVYWTEYIARHRGAPHLQSPAKKLSYIQILGLDIIAVLLLLLFTAYLLLKRLFQMILKFAFGAGKEKLL